LTRNDAENSREYPYRLRFIEIRRTLSLVGTVDNKYAKRLDSFPLKLQHQLRNPHILLFKEFLRLSPVLNGLEREAHCLLSSSVGIKKTGAILGFLKPSLLA